MLRKCRVWGCDNFADVVYLGDVGGLTPYALCRTHYEDWESWYGQEMFEGVKCKLRKPHILKLHKVISGAVDGYLLELDIGECSGMWIDKFSDNAKKHQLPPDHLPVPLCRCPPSGMIILNAEESDEYCIHRDLYDPEFEAKVANGLGQLLLFGKE